MLTQISSKDYSQIIRKISKNKLKKLNKKLKNKIQKFQRKKQFSNR